MAAQDLKIDILATDKTGAAFRSVQSGLTQINAATAGVRNAMVGLGGAIAALGAITYVRNVINIADSMDELSKRTGIAVETLSALSNTAALAGSSQEELGSALIRLNKSIAEAASGSKDQALAFTNLGVSVRDAEGNIRSTVEVLSDIADAFSRVDDGAIKTQYQMALFGKSGANLNEFLSKGSAGIKEFGATVSTEFAEQSATFKDNIDLLSQKIQEKIGQKSLPLLQFFNREFKKAFELEKASRVGGGRGFVNPEPVKPDAITLKPLDPAIAKNAEEVAKKLRDINDEIIKMTQGENALAVAQFSRMEGVTKPQIKQFEELLRQKAMMTAQDRELDAASREADEMAKKGFQDKVELINKAKKLYDDTRTPLEKMNIQMAELDRLLALGAISWDVYARATLDATDAFVELKDTGTTALEDLKYAVQGWGRDFTNVMTEATMTGKLNFSDMASSIIRDLIRIQIQKNITDPLVKAGTSYLDSFIGTSKVDGMRAMGGPVTAGKSYLVGENGPEIFIPRSSGTIDNDASGGGSGVTVHQTINLSAGVSQTVRAEVIGMMPRIMEATKAAVADSKRRGGSFGKMMA
jgi:hypothetical protein